MKVKQVESEIVSTTEAFEITCPNCGHGLKWFYQSTGMQGIARCCGVWFKIEPAQLIFSVHELIEEDDP